MRYLYYHYFPNDPIQKFQYVWSRNPNDNPLHLDKGVILGVRVGSELDNKLFKEEKNE